MAHTPTSPPSSGYRPDIDGLRAVAVTAVVVYHYIPWLLPGGFVGVDIFFVLSGFLITRLTLRRARAGRFSFVEFYARRAQRLLPALGLVVLATLGIGHQLYSPLELAALGHAAASAAAYGANIHFFLTTDYFVAPIETRPLLHLWSLGVEEQFYLVAPLGLWVLACRPRLLRIATIGVVLGSLLACLWATSRHPAAAFYLTPFRAWELGLGGLIAVWPPGPLHPRLRPVLAVLGAVAIGVACVLLDHNTAFPGVAALLPTLGTVALVIAAPGTAVGRLLCFEPMRRVGTWSYAWYLWHWPALAFASFLAMRPPEVGEALALAAATLLLSALSTHFVENPLRHWRPAHPRQSVGLGIAASLGLVLVGLSFHDTPSAPRVVEGPQTVPEALADPSAACAALRLRSTRPMSHCRFGAATTPVSLLVWGDSHAGVLGPALEDVATETGRSGWLLARNDCPPILGVDRGDLATSHQCASHNEQVLVWIRRHRPQTVVLHARWPIAVEGTRYGDEFLPEPRFVQSGARGRAADIPQSLQQTVDRIRALGAEVVLVGPVPEHTFDVPSVFERSQRLGLKMPAGPDPRQYAARSAASVALLTDLAEASDVSWVDPATLLCDPVQCSPVRDGKPLYTDINHLDPESARVLAPLLVAGIQAVAAPASPPTGL